MSATTRGDRAFVLGLLLLLACAASLTPIRSYDYWWHLATGRFILEHRAVPRVDPFSFTAAGTPWVDHEWLFQILAYLGHTLAGPGALVTLKTAAIMLLGLLMAEHLRREGHGPAGTALILTPVLVGAAFRFDVRPELATLILAPLVLHLVLRARDRGRRGPLIAVPLLVALWSNLHPGAILAPVFLGLGLLCTAVAEAIPRRSGEAAAGARFAPRLAFLTVAATLGTGLNPYGFRIYTVPFEVSRLLASLPSPNLEWQRPAPSQFPLFWTAAAAFVLVALVWVRRADPVATPAALLAGALAAAHLRNIGLFFVLLPYAVARPGRALVDALQRLPLYRAGTAGGRVRPGFVLAAVGLVSGVPLLLWLTPGGLAWGAGVAADNEPAAAADFLEREGVGARLFNDVRFGGYLIWRRSPAHPVFIDGRNEVYPDLLREVFAGLKDAPAWEALLERHGIDSAFLRYPPTLQKVLVPRGEDLPPLALERAFSAVYFPKERWALVYWDDDAMIFLKRTPEYRDVIARLEYRAVHPDDWHYLLGGVMSGRLEPEPILAEIRRKLAEDPTCVRALRLLAWFGGLTETSASGGGPEAAGGR